MLQRWMENESEEEAVDVVSCVGCRPRVSHRRGMWVCVHPLVRSGVGLGATGMLSGTKATVVCCHPVSCGVRCPHPAVDQQSSTPSHPSPPHSRLPGLADSERSYGLRAVTIWRLRIGWTMARTQRPGTGRAVPLLAVQGSTQGSE